MGVRVVALALGLLASVGCKHKLATLDVTTDGGGADEEADDGEGHVATDGGGSDAGGPAKDAAGGAADGAADASMAGDTSTDAAAPAVLSIASTTKDYAGVVIGASASADFDVSNAGGQATGAPSATIVGSDAGQFAVATTTCNGPLAPGAHCTVTVRFTPTTAGGKQAQLDVTASPGGAVTTNLTGTGLTPAALAITPATKDYSMVVTGTIASADFEVSNTGDQPTGVPIVALAGADAGQFAVTGNTCTAALATADRCTVTVRFSPTTTGLDQAQLTVMATPGGSVVTSLSGTGIPPGALTITPTNAAYASLLPGATSPAQSFVVKNTGGAATGTLAATIAGTTDFKITSTTCAGVTLAASAMCTISVALTPTAPGPESATLTVTAAPGGTASASLTGTALHPAQLSIAPTTFTFPGTEISTASATKSFTITNTGDVSAGSTTALATALSGTNAADFQIVSSTCTGTLEANGTCQVVLSFNPSAAGNRTATLTVSGAPGGPVSSAVAGSGLRPPSISGSPATLDFGHVDVAVQSAAKTWTIADTGDEPITGLMLTNSNTTELVVTNGCTTSLAGGAQCTVSISVKASAGGARHGALTMAGLRGGTVTLSVSASAGIADGQPCTSNVQCMSGACNTFYVDADGDTYGSAATAGFCTITAAPTGYATRSGDCCDVNPAVNPGVNTFQASAAPGCPGGTMVSPWDWNCSGAIEADLPNLISCGPPPTCSTTFGAFPDTSCGNPNIAPQTCVFIDEGNGITLCEMVPNGPTEAQRLQEGLGGLGVLGCM